MLVEVLDGFQANRYFLATESQRQAERPPTYSSASASIMIGLDSALSRQTHSPRPVFVGTVLDPSTYAYIPEAYEDGYVYLASHYIGHPALLAPLAPEADREPAPRLPTVKAAKERGRLATEDEPPRGDVREGIRRHVFAKQERRTREVLRNVPDKAAKILGLMDPDKPERKKRLFF
jgi:hypothetical protein